MVLRVMMHIFACSQSVQALESIFVSQQTLVKKFSDVIFEQEAGQCGELCLQLLRHCARRLPSVRSQVDPVSWNRDMQYVQAVEGVSSTLPPRKPRRLAPEMEKNSNARSALNRESDDEFLHCDIPLRRQCTCRKQPVQTAQLMRIHVVTPKAPITLTIQPAVEIPGQEGYYDSGEGPLQLSCARYYILQLPFIYSGPSGVWIPPVGVEKVGTSRATRHSSEIRPDAVKEIQN